MPSKYVRKQHCNERPRYIYTNWVDPLCSHTTKLISFHATMLTGVIVVQMTGQSIALPYTFFASTVALLNYRIYLHSELISFAVRYIQERIGVIDPLAYEVRTHTDVNALF
eukprot:TRINITY_DN10960_c0_g1_i1.p1 TRINITY_DN10960_c0_g1~~TRINITY_DN10960_c0_g1_i1.p1  ORF type:complete len:111 (-),score=1.51 TRINITY_DN10960_c0_g1_i1:50-382(-)